MKVSWSESDSLSSSSSSSFFPATSNCDMSFSLAPRDALEPWCPFAIGLSSAKRIGRYYFITKNREKGLRKKCEDASKDASKLVRYY